MSLESRTGRLGHVASIRPSCTTTKRRQADHQKMAGLAIIVLHNSRQWFPSNASHVPTSTEVSRSRTIACGQRSESSECSLAHSRYRITVGRGRVMNPNMVMYQNL